MEMYRYLQNHIYKMCMYMYIRSPGIRWFSWENCWVSRGNLLPPFLCYTAPSVTYSWLFHLLCLYLFCREDMTKERAFNCTVFIPKLFLCLIYAETNFFFCFKRFLSFPASIIILWAAALLNYCFYCIEQHPSWQPPGNKKQTPQKDWEGSKSVP